MTGNSNDARKNNFSIGNGNEAEQGTYQSEFNGRFTNYEGIERVESVAPKNNEQKNIVFGYDNPTDGAYYKSNYK